jgi:TonB-dependent receptor-like protein/carboxypeptidase family protein
MLRKLLSTLSVVVMSVGLMVAQNESAIKVKLIDKVTKETIPFANVIVEMGGIQAGVGTTNMDGEVTIKPLSPGKYNVKSTYVGYQSVEMRDINVSVGKTVYLNIDMAAGQQLDIVEVIEYTEPLIDPDTKSGGTITREEYQNMASKNINSVASTTAGVYQKDEGDDLNIRGSRSNGTAYYVDGQKVIGSSGVPQGGVEQVTSITGGTPAEYGDATGGIIAITTRGPASKYTAGIELISSGLGEKNGKSRGLDAFGYNFVGFSVNGPLLVKKDSVNNITKSVLGFSLSGQAVSEKDPDPSAVGFYQINPDKLAELEQSPIRPSPQGSGFVLNSEYVKASDLQKIKARNNVASKALSLTGKIQYQPTTNMSITFGGSVDYNKKHDFTYEYALFNPSNNSEVTANTWRLYAKLTQKFNSATSKEEEKSSSVIKNAYFTLQAGYEKTTKNTMDDTHKDKFFDYGYIGKFTQTKEKHYNLEERNIYDLDGDGDIDSTTAFFLDGFEDVSLAFTPGDVNPTGTPYTTQFYDYFGAENVVNLFQVQNGLGLANGDRPKNVYSAWYNTGRQYNGYILDERNQFRVFANFSADIKRHAIQVGFEYEQRVERKYSLNPIDLWERMRNLANFHLSQLDDQDSTSAILNTDPHFFEDGTPNPYAFYDFNRRNDATDQTEFSKSLRETLGYNVNGVDWLDVDSYDKDMYNLDMFSADDLLNFGGVGVVDYYGFDHHGNKVKGNPSLDDFFNQKDDKGYNTWAVGAYRPIYIAGYIQDKFDFKDLKFNVGVRIDRFDANQKVLKDKYLLYEAKTAGEVSATHPSNIGSDYVVYVEDGADPENSPIVGYRDGDTWYDANGVEVTDPSASFGQGGGQVQPYLVEPNNKVLKASAFKDYVPQINVMPRIAFSFPISDVANFYAHYDVLTQRPPDGYNRLDLLDYKRVENNQAGFVNNPDLKAERTTDYELGYQQVLNEKKNSSLQLSLFYREMRNQVQTTNVVQAYPSTYNSFSNVDFGTVKGLSIAYDLRRTATGVSLTANYTLQFADGTGSSTTDGQNLVSSGVPNLRTTHALDFDQRHTITLNMDYRFGIGKDYRGPRLILHKGKDNQKSISVLEDVGFNIVFRAGSGTPYSKQANITHEGQFGVGGTNAALDGQVNGSNLPWSYKVDLRVDKNFELTWGGKKEGTEKKTANLNLYLQVLNVLNTKNILAVYKATGNPDDDGYLASADAQTTISGQNDPDAFRDLYSVKNNNPSNYSRPRVIRIGVLLDF